jgi:hypothetical protein
MMAAANEQKPTQPLARVDPSSTDLIEIPAEQPVPRCKLEERLPSGACPGDATPPPRRPNTSCPIEDRLPSGKCATDDLMQPGGFTRPPVVRKQTPGQTCPIGNLKPDGGCAGHGTLMVASKPPAKLFVDGVDTGLWTPTKLVLSAGRHKIQFTIENSKYSFPVEVKEGETHRVVKDFSQSTP